MSAERVRAFRRTLTTYRELGVPDQAIAECVTALRGGTDTEELARALDQYTPAVALLDERPLRALACVIHQPTRTVPTTSEPAGTDIPTGS